MSRPFPAQYGGPCAADCGTRIQPGDQVAFADDELMHEECAARETESTRRLVAGEKPCDRCFLVHAGECL